VRIILFVIVFNYIGAKKFEIFREGPNKVAFFLQPLSDGLKLLKREGVLIYKANCYIYYIYYILTFTSYRAPIYNN